MVDVTINPGRYNPKKYGKAGLIASDSTNKILLTSTIINGNKLKPTAGI
jgi:hypothetical protein